MRTTWHQISGRAIVTAAALGLLAVAGVTTDREYRLSSPDEPQVADLVLARDAEDRQPGTG